SLAPPTHPATRATPLRDLTNARGDSHHRNYQAETQVFSSDIARAHCVPMPWPPVCFVCAGEDASVWTTDQAIERNLNQIDIFAIISLPLCNRQLLPFLLHFSRQGEI